ncbi:hypothetical protein AAFF_G00223740 [Aldrovandia affinis]|uniref:WD repeat-containing protein 93 n=1 Tax=Aldrovandia affinis TaxID=143900 RepID=A0AAD7TC92_9TELE|nr:hypothetical protein AAFF_G00223740 [Aldrovandia affinis]
MPVYIRRGPTEIPEPSEAGGSGDEDLYLKDPEQFQDRLPQPYRMIDKVLNRLLDKAWDVISAREASRIALQSKKKTPVLDPAGEIKLQKRTNCLSCSEDGKYVFVGHSHGLAVFSTSSLICVTTWEEESVEITFLHSACIGEMTYLLATVDDMGVSRLFSFCPDFIYLVKSINETDDISQRKICTKFELAEGGNFAAAVIECNGTSWLEVYRFPTESWLRELEVVHKQVPQFPGPGDTKFSPIGLILKIKPPKSLSGTCLKSPFEVLQRTEDGKVIGSGQNHMIGIRQWEYQEAVFKSVYGKYLCENTCKAKEAEERTSQCTFHFLLPGGLSPFFSEMETQSGVPIAVCVWWTGSHNLFQYTLPKTAKDKPDTELKPDGVWPNAHHILCSASSRCTLYISLGLADGVVTIWDRCFGVPWSVVAVLADSVFSRMLFLDQPVGPWDSLPRQDPFHPKVCVLVTSKSGTCHLITAGRGMSAHVTKLADRSMDRGTPVRTLHLLLKLVLLVYRNGDMMLQDMSDGADVYNLALPPSHLLTFPWSPVCALNPTQHTLFVQGHRKTCEPEDAHSSLFVFRLRESGCQSLSGCVAAERGRACVSVEETCNLYLQERGASLGERNKAMAECWSRLRELAERRGVHSAAPN